jgi:hypothetical protein
MRNYQQVLMFNPHLSFIGLSITIDQTEMKIQIEESDNPIQQDPEYQLFILKNHIL